MEANEQRFFRHGHRHTPTIPPLRCWSRMIFDRTFQQSDKKRIFNRKKRRYIKISSNKKFTRRSTEDEKCNDKVEENSETVGRETSTEDDSSDEGRVATNSDPTRSVHITCFRSSIHAILFMDFLTDQENIGFVSFEGLLSLSSVNCFNHIQIIEQTRKRTISSFQNVRERDKQKRNLYPKRDIQRERK